MKITKDVLITGTGCTTDRAIKWLDDVQTAMDKFHIESREPSRPTSPTSASSPADW